MIFGDRAVADAIGNLCEGLEISDQERMAVLAALRGVVLTERGPRLYYADLETMLLPNVDTTEGIWSIAADGILRGAHNQALIDLTDDQAASEQGLFLLIVAGDETRLAWWTERMRRAGNRERRRWAKFTRRVLKPLRRILEQG